MSDIDFLDAIRRGGVVRGLPIVLITPNKSALCRVVPQAIDAVEIDSRAEDLAWLLQRIEDAVE